MTFDESNKAAARSERSLGYVLKRLKTEKLKLNTDGCILPGRDADAGYCAVEWQRARWLVMEAVRWNDLFGSRSSISLSRALQPSKARSGVKECDRNFRSNKDYRFDITIIPGSLGEGTLGHLLCKRLPLYSPPITITFECKCDGLTTKTGNVFVEYEQRKDRNSIDETWKDSGVAVTEAHLYAFEWDYRCWVILPTKRLKAITNPTWERGKRWPGGDKDDQGRRVARGVIPRLLDLFTL